MAKVKEKNCRLCLKLLDNEYNTIDEFTRGIFEVLLLKVDLSVTVEPVVCEGCMNSLQEAYSFKSTCIFVNDQVISFAAGRNSAELDIKDVFLNENENKSLAFSADHNICRFCLQCQERNNFDLVSDLKSDSIGQMLFKCIPEVDLNVIKESMICTVCMKFLESYYSFANKCQNTEEIILKYYEVQSAGCSGQISLTNILDFQGLKGKVESIDNCSKTSALQGKDNLIEIGGETYSNVNNIEIKIEQENLIKNENKDGDCMTEENSSDEMKRKVVTCNKLYKCNLCSYESKWRNCLQHHLLTHRDSSNTIMYKCEKCIFETKYKCSLTKHMAIHKDSSEVAMYKCNLCSYEAKWSSSLRKHILTHKDSSDVIMYKCDRCTFESKYKDSLKKHTLIHRNNSEVTMYKCNLCSYESKLKGKLTRHMLIHKDSSDVVMYKCEMCTFETKYKQNHKMHMLIHKDNTEVTMYKCNLCSYEAKWQSYIKDHMLAHKDSSDIVMYKCAKCDFETKYKSSLRSHITLIHKDRSEVIMFKCKLCSYKTKRKCRLSIHMLIHKNSADVELYRCLVCSHVTKYKSGLKRHMMLMHRQLESD